MNFNLDTNKLFSLGFSFIKESVIEKIQACIFYPKDVLGKIQDLVMYIEKGLKDAGEDFMVEYMYSGFIIFIGFLFWVFRKIFFSPNDASKNNNFSVKAFLFFANCMEMSKEGVSKLGVNEKIHFAVTRLDAENVQKAKVESFLSSKIPDIKLENLHNLPPESVKKIYHELSMFEEAKTERFLNASFPGLKPEDLYNLAPECAREFMKVAQAAIEAEDLLIAQHKRGIEQFTKTEELNSSGLNLENSYNLPPESAKKILDQLSLSEEAKTERFLNASFPGLKTEDLHNLAPECAREFMKVAQAAIEVEDLAIAQHKRGVEQLTKTEELNFRVDSKKVEESIPMWVEPKKVEELGFFESILIVVGWGLFVAVTVGVFYLCWRYFRGLKGNSVNFSGSLDATGPRPAENPQFVFQAPASCVNDQIFFIVICYLMKNFCNYKKKKKRINCNYSVFFLRGKSFYLLTYSKKHMSVNKFKSRKA